MVQLPLVLKDVLLSPKNEVILYGGRLGGKSNGASIISVLLMLANPYHDVIVARASYGSMGDSSYAEMKNAIENMGEEIYEEFEFRRSPLRIVRKGNAGTIYFTGYGGSNTSRTKSIRTSHPIKAVIFEETQELKDQINLDQALASFRRHYGENVKVFIMGNPPPMEAHWFNRFISQKKLDPDYLVKRMTWQDIAPFINDYDLREILKTKYNNPDYYNWFYLGECSGGFGSVFPMFRKDKHIISVREFDNLRDRQQVKIACVVIGGDGAVTRDSTAFVPLLVLTNGQSVIGPIFYHNPQEDGSIGYHQLVQDHLQRWVDELCRRYYLGSPQEKRRGVQQTYIPMYMRIDSAAPDLIAECRFFLGDRIDINAITKRSVFEMAGIAQSAISNDNVIICDYGGYFSYVRNKWVQKDENLLAEQISMLIWNEKQTNYDPIVPNDVCDAWIYGNLFWYRNQENIQFFNLLKARNIQNPLIGDILRKKE